VVVAALVDGGPTGRWAEGVLEEGPLIAPHLMHVEVASILRRAALAEEINLETAALAHADLLDLMVEFVPYAPVADRVWELGANLTTYDAWYVATAEALGVPLATLDGRLARAAGPRCRFLVPASEGGGEG
jgi:predicted nucleic acid-binding protein